MPTDTKRLDWCAEHKVEFVFFDNQIRVLWFNPKIKCCKRYDYSTIYFLPNSNINYKVVLRQAIDRAMAEEKTT